MSVPLPIIRENFSGRSHVDDHIAIHKVFNTIHCIQNYGALIDGVTNDTAAIQLAINAAFAVGGKVLIPNGITRFSPNMLDIKSGGYSIEGEQGSILKVIDNPGDYEYLFTTQPRIQNVDNFRMANLTIDQNPAANTTCNVNVSSQSVMQFVFNLWSGTNITIENVYFKDCCGVNTVVISGPNVKNIKVQNCRFKFVKARTLNNPAEYDNSAIYLDGDGLDVLFNTFETTLADKARGAIELHGKNAKAIGNTSFKYKCIVRSVSHSGATADPLSNNHVISNNVAYDANDGINLWSITGHSLRGVLVNANSIFLDQVGQAESVHLGISLTYSVLGDVDGSFSDVIIANNLIVAEKETGRSYNSNDSVGIALQCTGAFANINVKNNIIRDFPAQGIRLYGRSTVNGVHIEDNMLIDCGNDSSAAVRMGLYINGTPKKSLVARNHFIDTGTPTAYGLTAIGSFAQSGSDILIKDNILPLALPHLAVTMSGNESTIARQAFSVSNGSTVSVDRGAYEEFEYTCPSSSLAFTIGNPYSHTTGQHIRFWIVNTSGSTLGTLTWDTQYSLAGAWVQPASGKRRMIEFVQASGKWYEVYRSAADIAN